ncbi:hypothetical protein OA57_07855 [Chelonobacter oris]|uniref:Opacity-associated protein A domain-containing protein n=1 Tax=Chelonobacter oris TaxID=505317 RepID=A0A0A3AKW9_9PAST|nr:LysM-like peptidoglycan-binding domain-containing protein [Chelonobacter oris]KGQ69986.1 hypothetical protein OA57_07855 [Chelonobacter oris]
MTSDNSQNAGDSGASSNDKQNQLKFEFSNMEPITPKKPIEEKPSFLDKAKGFLPKREHKEESVNPTNPQQPLQTETETETEQPETLNKTTEDTVREPLSHRLKKPETWGLLNRLPAKHRRLFIALLGLILVLLIFFWLKPSSTTTVDALQAQNANSLPIEFQPLNQSEEEAVNQPLEQTDNNLPLPPNSQTNTATNSLPSSHVSLTDTVTNTAAAATQLQTKPSAPPSTQSPAAQQPTAVTPPRYEAPKTQPKTTSKPSNTTSNQTKTATPPKATANKAATESGASVSNRTLTIPKGVSLMQVFRNNNLNIADVNAMTKANGGEKALSSFKPGDKVTIQLNSQGRVSRLTLQNGSSFSRNSDGSYQYRP